ncbi:MAG: hypothetical protein ACTSP4_09265 [Candidatus Hodarchaeales archaeon]
MPEHRSIKSDIELIDIVAFAAIIAGLIGVFETWFGSGTPDFVVILLSAVFTGGYGALRFLNFGSRPGLKVKGITRIICVTLIILMLWGQFRSGQDGNITLTVALLGAIGIDAASLVVPQIGS